jgi:hypothetical protein
MEIDDIEAHPKEGFIVLLGFYLFYLVDECKEGNGFLIQKHINFIRDLFSSGDELIIESIRIELFPGIHTEMEDDTIFKSRLDPDMEKEYLDAVKHWNELNFDGARDDT